MNQNTKLDWDYIEEQAERIASEMEFGSININMKVHRGQIVCIEEVETVKRTRLHNQPAEKTRSF